MSAIENLPKAAQKGRKAFGMSLRCPKCETEFSTVLDKRNYSSYVRRTRMCKNGHRFATREITNDELELLHAMEEEVNNLRAAAKKLFCL